MNYKQKLKILLVEPYGLGDAVISLPIVKTIRENFKDSFIIIACSNSGKPVYQNSKLLDEIIIVNFPWSEIGFKNYNLKYFFRFFRDLFDIRKRGGFDYAVAWNGDIRTNIFLALINAKIKANLVIKDKMRPGDTYYTVSGLDWILNRKVEISNCRDNGYNIKYRILEIFGDKIKENYLTPDITDFGDKTLHINNNKIAIVSGARSIYRTWFSDYWREVISHLTNIGKEIIFLDYNGQNININDNKNNSMVYYNNLDFNAVISEIKSAFVVISMDSGFAHVANALNKKQLILYGPASPLVFFPPKNKENTRFIYVNTCPYQPCGSKGKCNPKERPCMRAITPEMVIKELENIIKIRNLK